MIPKMIPYSFKVLRMSKDVILPTRATECSSGLDLFANEDCLLPPSIATIVRTGIKFIIPIDYEVQIRPRSGLAAKHSITVLNSPGTIDSDYRGEIKVIMINIGITPYHIRKGDRIAQAVLCPVVLNDPEEISEEEYNKYTTYRGEGGFGHSGK